MYQFPKWRYWLVVIVLALAVLLALPNAFLEDPAVQFAKQDRTQPMDAAAEQRALDILKGAGIAVKGSRLEGDRAIVRLESKDDQQKALRAVVAAGKEFSVALANASAAPAWMLNMGLRPMGLGLDLRGGIRFVFEVDVDAAVSRALDRLERDVRTTLREERIPYTAVAQEAGKLNVTLREATDLSAARNAVTKMDATAVVTTDDDLKLTISLSPETLRQREGEAMEQNRTILSNRVNALGVSEAVVQSQGRDRIVVELPGVQDATEAKRILGSTATLEWHMVDEVNNPLEAERTKRIPLGSKLYKMRENGQPVLLKRELIISAEQMADARSLTDTQSGRPVVSITLDARGGAAMLKNTQQNVGRRMGVLYIEKKRLGPTEPCSGTLVGNECTEESVISDAVIRGVFGNKFQIDGLSLIEANELALLLRAGALATPMYLVDQSSVGPGLGAENIKKGAYALVAGLMLTFLFMAVYYKKFGLVACAVLLSNVVLMLALLSLFRASLSLPSIAGVVLTVGMAVDANILIYERIREELRLGMSPQAAINAGFERAFSAILDSNVTTLIAGIVLWAVGTGPVRGFAVVLTLGIATSMFTAIVGSRALVHLLWGRRPRLERLSI